MTIHGEFINMAEQRVTVYISTAGAGQDIEVGDAQQDEMYFSPSPVHIHNESNDLFDVLRRQSATISFLTKRWHPELFSKSVRSAVVNISVDGTFVFAGYIEPQVYAQHYNEVYDMLTLNCVDTLTALQHSCYQDVGTPGKNYHLMKQKAGTKTFKDILLGELDAASSRADIVGGSLFKVYYDGSKQASREAAGSIFDELELSELLFYDDSTRDMWKSGEVVEELLRYLNLHIVQHGLSYYIFSWERMKKGGTLRFTDLRDGGTLDVPAQDITLTNLLAADCGAELNVGAAYSQLKLTAKVKTVEDLLTSPFDKNILHRAGKPIKAITEYSREGDMQKMGERTFLTGSDKSETEVTDWYMCSLYNDSWQFKLFNAHPEYYTTPDMVSEVLNRLNNSPGAAMLSIGGVKHSRKSNAPVTNLGLADYIVLSVNGDGTNKPTEADMNGAAPMVSHVGNQNASLSPAKGGAPHYIVFSGEVLLADLTPQSFSYSQLMDVTKDGDSFKIKSEHIVKAAGNNRGRIYTRKYWRYNPQTSAVEWWQAHNVEGFSWNYEAEKRGFVPPSTGAGESYPLDTDTGVDFVSKIPVLRCMLIVGDKCVVGNSVEDWGSGSLQSYTWQPYRSEEECGSMEEYYKQSFTLGVDLSIGDCLVGKWHPLQTNTDYSLGLSEQGTAIEIPAGSEVGGKVMFKILSPCDNRMIMDNDGVWRVHAGPVFGSHRKVVPLLSQVSNVYIKSFDIKLVVGGDEKQSGDGGNADGIVYASRKQDAFNNVRDDLEMKVHSALTKEESKSMGVGGGVYLSTVISKGTEAGVLSIYDADKDVEAKAEKLYIDSYYKEFAKPKVELKQNIFAPATDFLMASHFSHDALGKQMFVQGADRDLMAGTTLLNLKEI